MIQPACPQGSGNLSGEYAPFQGCLFKTCGLLSGQLKGAFGASDQLDAPLLDRWPETDQAIPKRRPLDSPPNR